MTILTEKTKSMIIELSETRNSFSSYAYATMMNYHNKLNWIKEELMELDFFIEIDKLVLEIPILRIYKYLDVKITISKDNNVDINGYTTQDYFIKVQEKAENYLKEQDFNRYKMQVNIIDILAQVKLEVTTERALKKMIDKLNKLKLIGSEV